MNKTKLADALNAVNIAFGAKLRLKRRQKDFSQAELAEKVGCSRVTIATIEGGKQSVPLHQIFLMARVLDVSLDTLIPTLDEVMHRQKALDDRGAQGLSEELFLEDARTQLQMMKKGAL